MDTHKIRAADLFGPVLLPTHNMLGEMQNTHASVIQKRAKALLKSEGLDFLIHAYSDRDCSYILLEKAQDFLSKPMDISYFVRPEEPKLEEYEMNDFMNVSNGTSRPDGFNSAAEKRWWGNYKNWQNWQPLFAEELDVDKENLICHKGIRINLPWVGISLNDFATHCFKQGIELKLNPNYEIN